MDENISEENLEVKPQNKDEKNNSLLNLDQSSYESSLKVKWE